jgi:quercetin dioxygenase-like cupin family protein
MFNGSKGRLELEVEEQTHLDAGETAQIGPGSIHGTHA